MQPHEKVHVGDTVHFVAHNFGPDSDRFPTRCRAGIVTAVDDMELVGLDGTSYAEHPIPMPAPPMTTRWYVSLAVFTDDAGTRGEYDIPGPWPSGLGAWHFATDCAVPHAVDWETLDGRTANGTITP